MGLKFDDFTINMQIIVNLLIKQSVLFSFELYLRIIKT